MTPNEVAMLRRMKHKFYCLPKAKKDEIAWYSARGMEAHATKLLMEAVGMTVQVMEQDRGTE